MEANTTQAKITDKQLKEYIPTLMQDYFDYMQNNNKAINTIDSYKTDLVVFFKFILQKKYSKYNNKNFKDINLGTISKDKTRINSVIDAKFIEDITSDDLQSYLLYLENVRKNSPKSRARKIVSLQGFYGYLHEQKEIIKSNPSKKLKTPKISKREMKYLTLGQCEALLKTIKEADYEFAIRDYAIITVFLNTGLRISELESLNLDVLSQNTIIGKGDKERGFNLNNACVTAIKEYLKVRPMEHDATDEFGNPLFLSHIKGRIGRGGIGLMLQKYIDMLGYKDITPHSLRHSFAMLMLVESDVGIVKLQKLMGHESLATTEKYTHVNNDMLKNAVDSNPLNR